MASGVNASLPSVLRPIQHYLKTAFEHDKRDPVVAYYCRLYALQKGMEIDKKSPESRNFLVALMDTLEKTKQQLKDQESVQSEIVGQVHVEDYALKMFLYADNEDRAARFNKNVVKSFYTAGMLFDVLSVFGELGEDIEKNKKYAKWKAAYIHKCLKNGETPVAGPLDGGDDDDALQPAPIGFDGFTQPNLSGRASPPSSMNLPSNHHQQPDTNSLQKPPTGAHAPPSTPQDQSGHSNTSGLSPAASSNVASQQWIPPQNPAGVHLDVEHYQKAIKYCKYASSSLQYEDSKTAIENLQKALHLLMTGQDS